ncbi:MULTISPECIES: type II secretion system secretin GspD [Methylomonas]|uniref:Type II secretion system protein GspD n=2 Tax=Methylomonas TaxID=416 RepID=A0A126T8K2_9GAMM|nr:MULTISPECIES: type II secretion system secretin GspD [Methylomonas]AMK78392.1 type II secretion system protein GspD [Methylomonas denitrificans]OAI04098.1 type II secretion system protein GspD [Methylomonas methanica]TCV87578.1 type II secretion system protein D (GspD) [Methylomonas methanica]
MTTKKINIPPMLALALSMTGCEFIGPQLHEKLAIADNKPAQEEPLLIPELANDANKSAENRTTKVELFPSGEASITPQASPKSSSKSGGKGEYSLNFDDADLGEVAKVILSDILGRNYTISPQVVGKVTLQTSKPLSKDELIPTLDMLLSLNNAALTEQAGMYLIKPSNEALYSSSISSLSGAKMPNGYQVRVIPVKNVAASELAEILKPLLPEKSLLHIDPNRNLILIAGSGAEISRALDVVNTFDVDILKGRSFALFTPANVSAGKIIEELEQIFYTKKSKDDEASFFRFIEIERLNAVLAITHQASYLKDIENWVFRLDRINTAAAGGVNVYRAQHVSATDLADTLSNIFGSGGSGKSSKASIASGRKSLSATNKRSDSSSSSSASGANRQQDSMSDRTLSDRTKDKNTSGSGALGGSLSSGSGGNNNNDMPNVKIIADEGNNALIIVATAQEYAVIERVLKQLDVLPLQVMIDATIVEVTLNDDLKYGLQWYFSHNNGGNNQINGGSSQGLDVIDLTKETAKALTTGGFSYAFSSGSKDIQAVLNASAKNNNVNVISSPSLMVLNNQEATIKVGDSVPIRSSVSSNLSSNNSNNGIVQTSSIQMIDTGVNLSVRPRVNAGGLVLMDILQSVNQAIKTTTSDTIDSPTIQKREIESSVAVQSGETIVLGGLIKENNDYLRDGVPLLHEIPLIGPLFGGTTRNKDKTELVVLLTPRVMKSRQDARDITDEFKRKLSGIYYQKPIEIDVDVEAVQ